MNNKKELHGNFIMAPVPVVLVGCSHEELGNNLLTIAWCGIDCSDPATVHVSIRPERHSYRMIKESKCFTVNMPTVDFEEKIRRAISEGTDSSGGGIVLMPSGAPYGRKLPPLALANYRKMVELIEL